MLPWIHTSIPDKHLMARVSACWLMQWLARRTGNPTICVLVALEGYANMQMTPVMTAHECLKCMLGARLSFDNPRTAYIPLEPYCGHIQCCPRMYDFQCPFEQRSSSKNVLQPQPRIDCYPSRLGVVNLRRCWSKHGLYKYILPLSLIGMATSADVFDQEHTVTEHV